MSIDPERDTVPWLAEFARYLPAGFSAAPGTPSQVAATAAARGFATHGWTPTAPPRTRCRTPRIVVDPVAFKVTPACKAVVLAKRLLDRCNTVPSMGVGSMPWVFGVDGDGVVRAKYGLSRDPGAVRPARNGPEVT